jgi:hypothetical protein
MPVTMAIISVVAVFSWQALYGSPWEGYSHFYSSLWPVFPYGLVIPIVAIAAVFFYRHEYGRYRAQWEAESPEDGPEVVVAEACDESLRCVEG